MPVKCMFDYVVNGLRVDVKGSHLGKGARWQFGMPAAHARQYEQRGKQYPKPINMSKRCEIVHCIGERDNKYRHFIIPASFVGTVTTISIKPSRLERYKWGTFKDRWGLLEE